MFAEINMSFRSSWADNPPFPRNASFPLLDCLTFSTSRFIFTAFSVSHILLTVPLLALVLCLGCQRRLQRRSIAAAPAPTSHSDFFAYHMAAIEMIAVLGCLFYCVGVNTNCPEIFTYGFYMFSSTWCAKTFFHTLTCVERYLAVVHPVAYLGVKHKGGIRVWNASVGFAWLLCIVWWVLMSQVHFAVRMIVFFIHVAFVVFVICFCCICVLRALRRPGPGKVAGAKEGTNAMKRRAFNTVVIIMGVLWFCLGGMLVCYALVESPALSEGDKCIVRGSVNWFSLPSSFVLPLLYLQRAGKLPTCKR